MQFKQEFERKKRNLSIENILLALQPPFLAQKYTFWSLDPRRVRRLSDEKVSQNRLNKAVLNSFEIKIQKTSVQNQKMPQNRLGTNVSFERNPKVCFTAV